MANGQGISRRVRRRFLQLAAIAFALGAEGALAEPANTEALDDGERMMESMDDEAGSAAAVPAPASYRHVFDLGTPALPPHADIRARVRVLDAQGRSVLQQAVHGASVLGPLNAGAYTVLVSIDGLTQVQQVRIGAGVAPWLHFRDSA